MATVISKDETKIGYEQSGTGPAIILVDGAMAHRDYRGGRPLAGVLSNHYTVIVYDRRGRGESADTQPYAPEREIEDIEALVERSGGSAGLYGFSSGSVLALLAAAKLGNKISKLAVLEPPFNSDDPQNVALFLQEKEQMNRLLEEGRNSDAVSFFLKDMLPPDMLENMKQSPDWKVMESVAPTLAYEYDILGTGALPREAAASVQIPSLVICGGESEEFKKVAARDLAEALPQGRLKMIDGHDTLAPAEVVAPILQEFF